VSSRFEKRLLAHVTWVAVVVALAWAVIPASTDGQASVTAGGTSALPDGTQPGVAGSTPSADGAGPGGTGTTEPGAVDAPGAAGASTTVSSTPGQAPTGATTELTASDRGVTPTSIRIGFTVLDLQGAEDAGFAVGIRGDMPEVIAAYVDAANRAGGAAGRQIEHVVVRIDPLSQSTQRAACLDLTETQQVFAVLDSDGFIERAAQSCVTIEHQTPLIHNVPLSAAFMRSGAPFDVSTRPDMNRILAQTVTAAADAGFFDPARGFRRLGLLTDECVPEAYDERGVGAYAMLESVGVGRDQITEFRTSCDQGEAQAQVAQAVLRHRGDGVTHVLPLTTWVTLQSYLIAADAQGFRPIYRSSDFQGLNYDLITKGFPRSQWDGTQGVTTTFAGELAAGGTLRPRAQQCSQMLVDAGLAPITDYQADALALFYCDFVDLFVRAANRAGPNPTRVGLGQAVQGLGAFTSATEERVVYDRPGKVSGGDSLATLQWSADCSCYVQTSPHRPTQF